MTAILCVDDDSTILTLLVRHLRRDGLEIRTTTSPEQALRWLADEEFAVLVSDYDMPGMTGAQLAGRAKRLRPETVRVMLTAQRDLETAVASINEGEVFRFVAKPFDPKDLRGAIELALERHRDLVDLYGDRSRRERSRRLREELDREHPGLSAVARVTGGRYVVRDPLELARELGFLELVEVLSERT